MSVKMYVDEKLYVSNNAGLDSYKDMVKGQFPFSLPLTVQFELRHSVRQYTQINTQTYQFYLGSQ